MRFRIGRRLIGTQYPEDQVPEGKKNLTEDEMRGCILSPRLHFTDAQIERARNIEIPGELIAREIQPTANAVKENFAKWLIERGNLDSLTDQDVILLEHAISRLIISGTLQPFAQSMAFLGADHLRQDCYEQMARAQSYGYTPLASIRPIDGDLNLSLLFNAEGKFLPDPGENVTGIHSLVDSYVMSTEPGGWNISPHEAIGDNIDELTYLTHRLTALTRGRTLDKPLQDFSTIMSFLGKHGSAKAYTAYHFDENHNKHEKALPADMGDLLRHFTKMKLHVGVSAMFKLATGKDTPIGNLDEVSGIRQLMEEKWGSNPDDLDENTRRRFDGKYDWYFSRMRELLDAPEDKALEIYSRINNEHQRRFSFPPPASTPLSPSSPWYDHTG